MTFLNNISNISFEVVIKCYGPACIEQYKSINIISESDIYNKKIKMKIPTK